MIQSVKVKNLSLSKDNVRKRNRDTGIADLAASIAAQGLLQNLIVTPLTRPIHRRARRQFRSGESARFVSI
jgi:ParB family chromosome partitioning protein